MPNYRYELKQTTGKVSAGVIAASSTMEAANSLRSQGGYILSLTEVAVKKVRGLQGLLAINIQAGPSQKDVLHFTSQLAVMIKAGISIRSALEGIADQVENVKFRNILNQIRQDVESGKPFSDALIRYPKIFQPLYVNMVKASELSGSFAEMLGRIVEYLSQ
ncbi:MAG: type II secretion system F family protein, partial [Planctomycetes bacterium]|nr:type II secretion system F family protein [Planctomycetota bacterium]